MQIHIGPAGVIWTYLDHLGYNPYIFHLINILLSGNMLHVIWLCGSRPSVSQVDTSFRRISMGLPSGHPGEWRGDRLIYVQVDHACHLVRVQPENSQTIKIILNMYIWLLFLSAQDYTEYIFKVNLFKLGRVSSKWREKQGMDLTLNCERESAKFFEDRIP